MNGLNKPLYRRRISEIYVQLLFEYLEKLGHDPEKVLGEPWPKTDSNHLEGVDIDHWESLLIIAKDYLNDSFIGLHVGQTITAQHLGVLGSVFLACENLGAVLERFERYQRLVYDVVPASVHIYPEYVELSWDTTDDQTVGGLSDETGRTVIVQFCRSLIRGKEKLKEIHFIHEQPENVQPYEEYFGCPVLFEQPVALMRFDREILSLPLKNSDAALVAILEKHADKLLASLPHIDEITDQVRKQIAYLLHQGEPTIEQLAERLNYSRRTLQRRLTEAGTNFRKELNIVRYELAKSYLKDPRLQIVEIALLLGYAEHSPFTRAYKEWSGKTPQQAREEMNN
ncbi:AraC family transcriptional regulator [Acinetobacter pittii]|uniref:AraC family transcriptional regulator n=1 Tax=Acinetobacter pittii TaxID=48296 RepID=UPI0021CDAFD7|nr:AraC family transcriptional regulator [Acinetobacter pittii]MCU4547383.1 AraC family transcriptional regulator [Acinetobacter pittii]